MKRQSVANPALNEGPYPCLPIDPNKLLHSIVDVICVVDENSTFHYVSPSSIQLWGYTPQEMMGVSFLHFIHSEDIVKTVQILQKPVQDGYASHFENRYYHKDGTVVPIIWSGRWDENDRLWYCVARNGSEKLEVEQRLNKAQQMARVANFEYDVENDRYTYTSDTLFEIFGLDRSKYPQFTSELFWTLVHPDDLDSVRKAKRQPEHLYNSTLEYRIIRPDGKIVYIHRQREIIRNAHGTPIKTIGTLQDITDRKLSELTLQRSEERFRSLVQNGNDLLSIIDKEGNYIFVGTNLVRHLHFGRSAEELVGKNAFDFIHPDDVEKAVKALQEIKEKDSITIGPFRFQNAQGEWRWIITTVSNHLAHPAIAGLVTNSRDVTEQKLKDDALKRSEKRFKALVQNGSDLIVIIDENKHFTYLSDNAPAIIGYEAEELVGKNVLLYVHPEDQEKVAQRIQKVFENNVENPGIEHRFLHKNGNWIHLESRGSNHQDNDHIGGLLVNVRNITERVRLQKRLYKEQQSKQKEIMTAVIKTQEAERTQLGLELHDNVNQILTTVKLYNEMYLSGPMPNKELLVKATQYTQDCINEIRSISKRLSTPTLGKISLRDSLAELVDSINLTRRLQVSYLPIDVDNCSIGLDLHLAIYRIVQEGLNNIIKYSGAQKATIQIQRHEQELQLTIWDNGKGFDTREQREGIGITNMRTRAENLNATFHLQSGIGKGCEIKISFPYKYATLG